MALVSANKPTSLTTLGIGTWVKDRVTEHIFMKMARSIRDSGSMTFLTVGVSVRIQMEHFIKASGAISTHMARVKKLSRTALHIVENLKWVKNQAQVR